MPFGNHYSNIDEEENAVSNTEQFEQDQFEVEIPQAEVEAIEKAAPVFQLTQLPPRSSGAKGRPGKRGPRMLNETMAEALHASEDPDAAIVVQSKSITPQMKDWAEGRLLQLATRGGKIYLVKKQSADAAPEL